MKNSNKRFVKIFALILSIIMTFSVSMPTFAAQTDDSSILSYDYVEELPDGGKIYTYIIDGIENSFPVPPEGFSPLTASDETLETYGFPPRPTDEEELIKWETNMAAYKTTPIPEIEVTDVVHQPFEAYNPEKITLYDIINTDVSSGNWSGYVAKGGTNEFAQVQGDFVQPTIQSGCSSNTYESTWVGLGGYNSNRLVQTGTAMNTKSGGKNYYAWYEIIGTGDVRPEVKFNSVTVNAGDKIHCYVSFQRANNKFNAYIANNTNGTSQSVIVSNLDSSKYYDGTTAEFVNERPLLSNRTISFYAPLTKYGTTNWTNCQVYKTKSTWTSLGSLTTDRIIMKNGSKSLATPSGLSGKTFKSTWNNYS